MDCFGAAITQKPHYLPQNGQKIPVSPIKQCSWGLGGQLWGLPPYFEGAAIGPNVQYSEML